MSKFNIIKKRVQNSNLPTPPPVIENPLQYTLRMSFNTKYTNLGEERIVFIKEKALQRYENKTRFIYAALAYSIGVITICATQKSIFGGIISAATAIIAVTYGETMTMNREVKQAKIGNIIYKEAKSVREELHLKENGYRKETMTGLEIESQILALHFERNMQINKALMYTNASCMIGAIILIARGYFKS